eukprot:jgi/Tetstr1/445077/TSEL_032882.t1
MARTSLCSAALGALCLLVVFHSIAVAERHFPTKGGSLLSAESVRSGSKHGDVSDELADAPGNGDGTYITSLDPDELDFQQDMPPGDAVKPLHDSEALAARAHVSPNAEMHVLSMEHRVFYYPNFLTDEEADHIRELAEPNLVRSKVIDSKTGISRDDSVRTSQSSSLRRSHDEVVAAVDQRIEKWTLMPANHGEGLNVLRYQYGQKYSGHWDYFFNANGTDNGGNRAATVLMYLTDVEEGGETTFPNIPLPPGQVNEGFSDCARTVLAVKPKKGAAIMFWSVKPTGELNVQSLHEACPVIKGTKWSAAKWIRMAPYAMGDEKPVKYKRVVHERQPDFEVEGCIDKHKHCGIWSEMGKCKTDKPFMVGTSRKPGNCLRSCNRCKLLLMTASGLRKMEDPAKEEL